jgi:hypothetical protein
VKSTLRFLLVCYLLLALPFQAFAAASMRLPAASMQPAAKAQLPPCHQQMMMDHDHKPVATATQHDKNTDKDKGGSCGTCCVGAAMAPSLPATLALAPPRTVLIPFRAGHLPSVDPVLLERPPSLLPA